MLELPLRRLLLSPEILTRRLELNSDDRVLEIGAGSGYYTKEISTACRRLIALDLQPEMLRRLRAKGATANVLCLAADASRLPFQDESFNVVLMVAVFGEVLRPGDMLTEVRRVLQRNGTLSISEHLPDPDFTRFSTLKALVQSHGFKVQRFHGRGWSYTANFIKT